MLTPIHYQTECLNEMDWFGGRVLLAADMGLGKTAMALWFLERDKSKRLPAVIVCPASVKYVWEYEAQQTIGIRPDVAEGRKPPRGGWSDNNDIIVINYDILPWWLIHLKQRRARTVIIDECQFTMNPRAKRTKAVRELCKGVKHVLALSGTPLLNRPIELFPVLKLICPSKFSARGAFAHRYCKPKWTPWGWQFNGADNVEELHEKLRDSCMVRRRKVDVLPDLPEKLRRVIPLPLSSDSEYQLASKDFLNWLRRRDPSAAQRASKAEELSRIGYLLRLCARLKLLSAVEWINDWLYQTDEKLVVFARHAKMVEALKRRCKVESVVVDGSVTGRLRKAVVDKFQEDKRTRLFIGNIHAAGVGITLTASSTVVFTEMAWRPADHTQAEDRCHRIGTKQTVWCYYLVARDTIEQRLCEVIQKKQSVISNILDGKDVGDLDVFDQLLKEMKK